MKRKRKSRTSMKAAATKKRRRGSQKQLLQHQQKQQEEEEKKSSPFYQFYVNVATIADNLDDTDGTVYTDDNSTTDVAAPLDQHIEEKVEEDVIAESIDAAEDNESTNEVVSITEIVETSKTKEL